MILLKKGIPTKSRKRPCTSVSEQKREKIKRDNEQAENEANKILTAAYENLPSLPEFINNLPGILINLIT